MFKLFFTFREDLPPDVGFPMYGRVHMLWLLLGVAAVVFICLRSRKQTPKEQLRTGRQIAVSIVASMVIRHIILIGSGFRVAEELPLQLCGLAGLFCLYHSLAPHDWSGQLLYAMFLPGAVASLIFPNWNHYPPISFVNIQGFTYHFAIVAYIALQLTTGRITPSLKGFWDCAIFLCIVVPPIYVYNRHFDTNYLFINLPSPGSPLELFVELLGNPGYLIPFGLLTALVIFLMELIGVSLGRRKRASD